MILLLSGAAGIGKSSLSAELISQHEFRALKSSAYLRILAADYSMPITRLTLQELGDRLDNDTDFRWLVDHVAVPQLSEVERQDRWLLDSVRKPKQVEHFRSSFGKRVVHVHLTASEETLRHRVSERVRLAGSDGYETSYEELVRHPNEVSARGMGAIADIILPYDGIPAKDAALELISQVTDV